MDLQFPWTSALIGHLRASHVFLVYLLRKVVCGRWSYRLSSRTEFTVDMFFAAAASFIACFSYFRNDGNSLFSEDSKEFQLAGTWH
jgi:hypothetical protein